MLNLQLPTFRTSLRKIRHCPSDVDISVLKLQDVECSEVSTARHTNLFEFFILY